MEKYDFESRFFPVKKRVVPSKGELIIPCTGFLKTGAQSAQKKLERSVILRVRAEKMPASRKSRQRKQRRKGRKAIR
ncbi:hypothetical protein [Allobaculum fili]|uniref:hypothetical protein n=1 Tax=Allobaculum TaxID=174708 RepID=UPI001E3ECED6|nr:hypothetical protein [Allobaculum fili]